MSRNTRIVLGVMVAAIIVLCLCACIMAFSIGSWFINRTVTVGTDSVQRPVGGDVAGARHQLQVDGSGLAASILSGGWR